MTVQSFVERSSVSLGGDARQWGVCTILVSRRLIWEEEEGIEVRQSDWQLIKLVN